ncbi:autotransporter outer membrane beta-barrel domain-containing protein [Tenacibaculum gallaicum]|nr:hypothetical protein [Tenacibaculum gallaicum]
MTFKFRHIYNIIKLLVILLIITFSDTVSSQEIRVIDNKGTIQKVNNNNVFTSPTDPNNPTVITVENDVWFDTTNSQIKIYDTVDGWKPITSTLTSQNIYTADGTLADNRILNGNANNLTFNNINFLQLFSTFGTQISSTGGTMQISSGTSSQISAGTTMELSAPSNIMLQSPTEFNSTLLDVNNSSGTSGQILSSTGTGVDWIDSPSLNSWLITGNNGTNSSTNFLGTIDAQDLVLRAGNIEKLRLNNNVGQVLVNQASVFNTHPLVIRANGVDVLAFEDNTGTPRWHWNLLADGLNFVESNVEDYRLFLENGGEVGINTNAPTERLDVNGRLRVRDIQTVTNTTDILTTNASGVIQKKALLATEANNQITTGTNSGVYLGPTVYTGAFIINSSGSITVNTLPFQPSQITFVAHANVESFNLDTDNGVGNNNSSIANSFGTMNGFARDNGGTITQQVIYVGGSGNSINDISRFASSSNCIGLRYSNQNGDDLGKITASLASFNTNGFTINVSRTNNASTENLVVLYTAYK